MLPVKFCFSLVHDCLSITKINNANYRRSKLATLGIFCVEQNVKKNFTAQAFCKLSIVQSVCDRYKFDLFLLLSQLCMTGNLNCHSEREIVFTSMLPTQIKVFISISQKLINY